MHLVYPIDFLKLSMHLFLCEFKYCSAIFPQIQTACLSVTDAGCRQMNQEHAVAHGKVLYIGKLAHCHIMLKGMYTSGLGTFLC